MRGRGAAALGGGVVKRCLRSWLFVFLLLPLPLPFHSEKVEGIKEGKTSAFKGPFGGVKESGGQRSSSFGFLLPSAKQPPLFTRLNRRLRLIIL